MTFHLFMILRLRDHNVPQEVVQLMHEVNLDLDGFAQDMGAEEEEEYDPNETMGMDEVDEEEDDPQSAEQDDV